MSCCMCLYTVGSSLLRWLTPSLRWAELGSCDRHVIFSLVQIQSPFIEDYLNYTASVQVIVNETAHIVSCVCVCRRTIAPSWTYCGGTMRRQRHTQQLPGSLMSWPTWMSKHTLTLTTHTPHSHCWQCWLEVGPAGGVCESWGNVCQELSTGHQWRHSGRTAA